MGWLEGNPVGRIEAVGFGVGEQSISNFAVEPEYTAFAGSEILPILGE